MRIITYNINRTFSSEKSFNKVHYVSLIRLWGKVVCNVEKSSYGVYTSQRIHFARVSSHVGDFNTRNKVLTAKLHKEKHIDIINYMYVRRFQNFIGGFCLNV